MSVSIMWKSIGCPRAGCCGVSVPTMEIFSDRPRPLCISTGRPPCKFSFMYPISTKRLKDKLKIGPKAHLKEFVASAERRCRTMYEKYVAPFKKYLE